MTFNFPSDIAICGCGSPNSQKLQCCMTMDLGQIYEELPDYKCGDPCQQTGEYYLDADNNCNYEKDSDPCGEELEYRRACARLVVWQNAKISGGLSGNRIVLYSRQRNDLPKNGGCVDPIRCPAENGIFHCCLKDAKTNFKLQIGGPYLNCTETGGPACKINCRGKTPPFKYGISGCEVNGLMLAGYAIAPSNWWFLGDAAFGQVVSEIVGGNPWGKALQTVYAHFSVQWKPIKCKTDRGNCGTPTVGNRRSGRCGSSRTQGYKDKQKREKTVKIEAAIGWSLGGCGLSPQESCQRTYS